MRSWARPSTLPPRTITARAVVALASSAALMPMSMGVEIDARPTRDKPLIRRLALPSGMPLSPMARSMLPETRPLTSKAGQTMESSDSETRSSCAFTALRSPNWPEMTILPSGVMTVTGASAQPPGMASRIAGPDRVIGRSSRLPLVTMVMRPSVRSASSLMANGTSARPLAVATARPWPLA